MLCKGSQGIGEGGRGWERKGGRGRAGISIILSTSTHLHPSPQSVTQSIRASNKEQDICLLEVSDLRVVQEMFPSFADTGRQLSVQGPP